jgi:hypothetical protein
MRFRTLTLALAIVALYALHQDVWFWRTARPLVFGFLPVGLAYHGAYCVAAALLMWTLTKVAWPHHLEESHHLEEPHHLEESHHREEDSRR